MKRWMITVLLLALAACGAAPSDPPAAVNYATELESLSVAATLHPEDNYIEVTVNEVEVVVPKPENWEYYATDYGIVLTEHIDMVATNGELGGMLTHIWVPPLDDLALPANTNTNLAWHILSEIIEDPAYVGSAAVSEPQAFTWSGHDAAYYLLNNDDGNLSIVIGIAVPNSTRIVTCSIGAPGLQSERIREVLPMMLDGLTINGIALSGAELDVLPDPFVFPQRDSAAHNRSTQSS